MDMARFRQDEGGGAEEEPEVPCFLDIYVRSMSIHGSNQAVYAKFALTSAPDHAPALCTRVAAPVTSFHQRLGPLRVRRLVDVLKCEVCRLGDGHLLGFALVPLAAVAAADGARLSQLDLELSSTDLSHSPAGTVRLSLALHSGLPGDASPPPPEIGAEPSSITSEVVLLDPPVGDNSRMVESPDDLINNVVKESNHGIGMASSSSTDKAMEQSEMQRHIMEMYVRSVQQFSETLARTMNMPVEIQLAGERGVVGQRPENEVKSQQNQQQQRVKNDGGARVFYGSRAFF